MTDQTVKPMIEQGVRSYVGVLKIEVIESSPLTADAIREKLMVALEGGRDDLLFVRFEAEEAASGRAGRAGAADNDGRDELWSAGWPHEGMRLQMSVEENHG